MKCTIYNLTRSSPTYPYFIEKMDVIKTFDKYQLITAIKELINVRYIKMTLHHVQISYEIIVKTKQIINKIKFVSFKKTPKF